MDGRAKLLGYELLYRRAPGTAAGDLTLADEARSLINALVEIGLNDLVGKQLAFINLSEDLILSGGLKAIPKERAVLEVLEHVRPTPEIRDELESLRREGYTIALDDFLWNDLTVPLLPYAEIVKVDITQLPQADLPALTARLQQYPVRLLAERVETREELDFCRSLGFTMFQGYFFAKPELVEGRVLSVNHATIIRLLTRLHADDLQFDEIEELIATEVQLNVRLLRFIKSAHLGMPKSVDSVRKALMFVGIKALASIATLLLLTQMSHKPDELIAISLIRAKMSEHLATASGLRDPDRHFTVGMLSMLDAMLDQPMADILSHMPLSDEVNEALLNPDAVGELADLLRAVRAYERGDFDAVSATGFPLAQVSQAYHQAIAWAGSTQRAMAA